MTKLSADYIKGFRDAQAIADTIALDLETRWRATAKRCRKAGTFSSGWPFRLTRIKPRWEEAAADGLRAVRLIISQRVPGAANLPAADGGILL